MNGPQPLSIDVVVPSYRRPEQLARCLGALAAQERAATSVIVVTRADDRTADQVLQAAKSALPLIHVTLTTPGTIAALRAGTAASRSDVVAFTDDDARPRPDWLARLADHLRVEDVGAIGGRDVIAEEDLPLSRHVGVFARSGALTGNHHLGTGPARDVDTLKGVNMAFRRVALAIPEDGLLRGTGAQVGYEIVMCAYARRAGWRVVYDPDVVVDHEPAGRHGADQRTRPTNGSVFDAAHNSIVASTVIERTQLPQRAGFSLAVGTRDKPGPIRALVAVVDLDEEVLRRFLPSMAGKVSGAWRVATRPGLARLVASVDQAAGRRATPHVVFVAHDVHDHGGMERSVAELIRRMAPTTAITVVSSTIAEDLIPLVEWRRVRIPRRPFPAKFVGFAIVASLATTRARLPGSTVQTVGAIIANPADVISLHFCHAGYRERTGALAPPMAPRPRKLNTALSRSLALAAERWCYRPERVKVAAAVSTPVANEFSQHYEGIRTVVVPNGVDHQTFRPDAGVHDRLRGRERGCGLVSLFVGGDWDRKGLDIAIGALAVAREAADLELWVVGRGDTARFGALAERLGVREQVVFLGERPDVADLYRSADIFVLPSSYESFSLVALEAAASGLPLVLPDVGVARDLVGADEGGRIVERTTVAFGEALKTLALDPGLRAALGARARANSMSFTWQRAADEVASLHRSLAERIPSRA